jgi:hypothetical protein
MKKARTVTVSNDEILRTLYQRTMGADDARLDRLVALETVSNVRTRLHERELKRLTEKHGAAHPLVTGAELRLQAGSTMLRAMRLEIERTSLTPPSPSAEAWTVFGIVRTADGAPLPGVLVLVVDEQGETVAPDKPVPAGKDGAFTIVVPLSPRKVLRTKAADSEATEAELSEKDPAGAVHLEVFKSEKKRIAVDTVAFQPALAVVDYREIVVGTQKPVDKRAK